jgi:hypothetical protein
MKRLLCAIIAVLLWASVAASSSFCAGWADGYRAGYCYQRVSCISPIVPICPLPRIGEGSYGDGYDRGFLAGMRAR